MNSRSQRQAWASILLFVLASASSSCNRAYTRIPGASLNFPPTKTQYQAAKKLPYHLVVALPVDVRSQHYGKEIARSDWYATRTDALWVKNVPTLIQERLVQELRASGLFASVRAGTAGGDDVVLKTDVRAFSSDSRGFLWVRVAGMTALHASVEKGGKKLLDQTFERTVTDGNDEYTGDSVGFLEQVMKVTMSDSLRETMRDMLQAFESKL